MSLDAHLIPKGTRFPCQRCGRQRPAAELRPVLLNYDSPNWAFVKWCKACRVDGSAPTPQEGTPHG